MSPGSRLGRLLLICLALSGGPAAAQSIDKVPLGEAVERHLTGDEPVTQRVHDPDYLELEQGDSLETREVEAEELETVKLTDLVPPIRFESGVADIPDSTVVELREILADMQDRRNVRLHLVGHADNQPLSSALAAVFGDNEGLSRERAGEVAEFLQTTLALPPEAVSYEWAGDAEPVASNETPEGRALNRRVEVEIWYDEVTAGVALEEFLVAQQIRRVKVCRMETVCKLRYVEGHAHRARVQNLIAPLNYDQENVEVSAGFVERVRQALANLGDKQNVVVKFVGFTDDTRLTGREERIYGTDVGLSRARARRVALAVQDALALPTASVESDGRGAEKPLGSNATAQGRALNRRVEVEFWYDDPLQELPDEPQLCPGDAGSTLVTRVYDPPWGELEPVRLEHGVPLVPADLAADLRRAMNDVSDKANVRVRFVGYTGNERLDRRTAIVYGDDIGLSAARARRTMEVVAEQMQLEAGQAEFEGRGYLHSSDVVNAGFIQGESSHVIAEVVYDDLAVLDDYEGVDITKLTREMSPKNPFGLNLMRITVDGEPIDDPNRSSSDIQRCTDVALQRADIQFGFDNLRANPRLSASAEPATVTFVAFGDEMIADATVRFSMYANYAHYIERAEIRLFDRAQSVRAAPLDVVEIEVGGLAEWQPASARFVGPLHELKYVLRAYGHDGAFDETAPQPLWLAYEEQSTAAAAGLMVAREAASAAGTAGSAATGFAASASAVQRSVGQAGRGARAAAQAQAEATTAPGQPGEVDEAAEPRPAVEPGRPGDSAAGGEPADTDHEAVPGIETEPSQQAEQREPGDDDAVSPADETADETADEAADATTDRDDALEGAGGSAHLSDTLLLGAYGENELATRNIAVHSGTVTVQGSQVPDGHTVWVAGQPVPVDAEGNFVAETILPTGLHTVEVAVLDPQGNGELFLRDLELKPHDWFYVGMADLTLAQSNSSGPMDLLQGDNPLFDNAASSYGRLAFYVNGKFGEQWELAASADTREEPLGDLFSNFMNKSPDSLFRRIDPDYHYPTFGDDSTVDENAATLGRFFVRLGKGENYGLWGNFKVGYMNNELAQVDRGLYGGTLHYQTSAATSFGEQRFAADAFTAEPGTIPSREEFRGTGGSLYFLRRQDILTGSERVRIELRDKASGIVTGVLNLRPVLDYDIDYLQGRIVLSEPLVSSANESLLVRSNALGGDEAYLVVRYEYTPGFEELDALSVGGQVHYWLNDYVKLGLTANTNEQGDTDSDLGAADLTVRKSEQTWLKLQSGRTEGFLTNSMRSDDGGFGFYGLDDTSFVSADAKARRTDISVGLNDFFELRQGRVVLYDQELDAGYAAPGLATLTDAKNYGGSFTMPVTDRVSLTAKVDRRIHEQGIETEAQELDLGWQVTDHWDLSTGIREDFRRDSSPVVPLTQQQGERQDAVVQAGYDALGKWWGCGGAQDTRAMTGDREANARVGMGGTYRVSERLGIDLEVSDGDLGKGGKLGTNYRHSERTSLYLNYALENERTDNGLRSNRGSEGNLVAGAKMRFSDSTSVFLEERRQDNEATTGLTHSMGISLAPTDRLNLGANTDIGTLRDQITGAQTERTAGGVQIGYGFDALQFSSGIEYRNDESEQLDLTTTTRTTWLLRNNFKFQMTPASRLLGKLNHSESDSSQGQFYDGGYTEAVFGFGYRPVRHDRLNAMVKYTYFYNVPTTDQITLTGTVAEFIQKSHIASFDATYEIKPRWSIGAKYAHRVSEVSLDRENPQFFDNGADLYVLRADWEFRKDWEAMLETRLLDMSDIGDRRSGAVVVVSRYLGRHIKVGAGYNFTSFSDDLTDLSFDHKGTFVTLTGAM